MIIEANRKTIIQKMMHALDEFKEGDHPRAPDGKFGSSGSHEPATSSTPLPKLKGSPAQVKWATELRENWKELVTSNINKLKAAPDTPKKEEALKKLTRYEEAFNTHSDAALYLDRRTTFETDLNKIARTVHLLL